MAKWAVGVRLKSPTLRAIEEALAKGEILRTHVMRTTWHDSGRHSLDAPSFGGAYPESLQLIYQ